jgi:hypothetical protein
MTAVEEQQHRVVSLARVSLEALSEAAHYAPQLCERGRQGGGRERWEPPLRFRIEYGEQLCVGAAFDAQGCHSSGVVIRVVQQSSIPDVSADGGRLVVANRDHVLPLPGDGALLRSNRSHRNQRCEDQP